VLLLFDIDGTLVSGATEAHGQALHDALLEVHGIDSQSVGRPPSPAGRTDGEISRAILLGAGVSAERIDERAEDVRDACCRAYARLSTQDLSHAVLPGMRDLLAWLSGIEAAKLALLTGNFEPVARIKLARAGIGNHFPSGQGAFGSDAEDRAALPAIARRRAGTLGHPYEREQTIVIGDTPRDIACARADGVRCVAVATGPFRAEELVGADAVVDDADGLRGALEAELAGWEVTARWRRETR
jgi:phosphoglycolate phosphatase-like HAD superfamily hydrolase